LCFQENSAILKEVVELRAQKSSTLGFTTHADFVLEMNMAKSEKKVAGFLGERLYDRKLHIPALITCRETHVLQQEPLSSLCRGFNMSDIRLLEDLWSKNTEVSPPSSDMSAILHSVSNLFVLLYTADEK